MYPHLSRMALDYLTIPATSVDIERLFSKGRIVLPYLCNRLSSQSTRALLCLRQWSKLGLVKDADICKATCDEVEVDEGEVELA
ncbi:hypothetical protein SCLCIDRAFT_133506 [Scleroderma citrinum Foug A]|uniref:HAT C-terminal dimerisation domain-containing protein n=1 Tax=Scleroderma citrinum Foug A TaxID=1036808 RepID=A0A0C2ZU40_9AGAM|nr:hypothetical protein SCLCIDRAFT_133506 [Scleroderma citrinum Foug A]